MSESRTYTLCGGTFLVLLLRARKLRTTARRRATGETDGLNESDVFEGLLRVAFPGYERLAGRSFGTSTSSYKACRLSANESLPFNDTERIDNFNREVLSDYASPLRRMCEFTDRFIDANSMGNWLVRAVLETISWDPSITDELFYVDVSGQPVDRAHLLGSANIDLQPFLLGIWHFILVRRQNNEVGSDTYEYWHKRPASNRAKWEFVSDVGKNWNQNISVNIISFDEPYREGVEAAGSVGPYRIPQGMTPVFVQGSISTELTEEPPLALIPTELISSGGKYSEYMDNARHKYDNMKTLLYSDAPRRFYGFYVCNDISVKIRVNKHTYSTKLIHDATIEALQECSNFVLITGTGGLGKSMMMRHLLLDSIERFDEHGKLPIFIPVKDYDYSHGGLLEYILGIFESLGGTDDIDELSDLLSSGSCILLFDGMDEIKTDCRAEFEHDLNIFTDRFPGNMFVVSSRPTGSFISLNRFSVFDLRPFNKKQALALIDKLDFRPDEPAIKENFHSDLEQKLFISHKEFTQNPLLLTIMLMTYEQFAEIPSKMHIFYREAYVALSQKHDASKGAYKRVLKTGLNADRFSDYFAEFCARSYRDEKFEFNDIMFKNYFDALNERKKDGASFTASDFKDDLVENMCLMFYEGGKYHFTHRSFQEYFCALYFSRQKDKNLKAIGDFFENKRVRQYTDNAFYMLYDMIPEKVEEYIFQPFLQALFEKCDKEHGYWTFLQELYPYLYFDTGGISGDYENEPESFIYGAIIHINNLNAYIDSDDLLLDDRFIINEWVYINEDYHDPDFDPDTPVDLSDVPSDYIDQFGVPAVAGRNYEISIEEILGSPEENRQLLAAIDSKNFPLKKEFLDVKEYLQQLIYKNEPVGDDLFDLLR